MKFLKENKNNKGVWYHTTEIRNLDNILKEGLKINMPSNFSVGSTAYMSNIYNGITPIFISKDPDRYNKDNKKITFEISGLDKLNVDIVVDIPTIISEYRGQIPSDFYDLDEKFIYFEERDVPYGMGYLDDENGEAYISDMINPNSNITKDLINLSGTAAVMNNIPPENIKLYKG